MVVTARHSMSSLRNRPPAEKEKLGARVTNVRELVTTAGLVDNRGRGWRGREPKSKAN